MYSLIFLRPALAFLLQLLERRIDAGQQLEDDRGRDVRHDAQAEDRDVAQLAGAEHGDGFEHVADAAALAAEAVDLGLIDDRQRDLKADAIDRQHQQRQTDLRAQLGNLPDDANFFPHGVEPVRDVSEYRRMSSMAA